MAKYEFYEFLGRLLVKKYFGGCGIGVNHLTLFALFILILINGLCFYRLLALEKNMAANKYREISAISPSYLYSNHHDKTE